LTKKVWKSNIIQVSYNFLKSEPRSGLKPKMAQKAMSQNQDDSQRAML